MDFDITLYTRTTCSECTKVKKYLEFKKIEYTEKILDKDLTREELLDQFPTAKSLPVITTSDRAILNGLDGLQNFFIEKGA